MTKSISMDQLAGLQRRALVNLGGCLIARVDGKSPVEYLNDPVTKDRVRAIGWNLLNEPHECWEDLPETIINRIDH